MMMMTTTTTTASIVSSCQLSVFLFTLIVAGHEGLGTPPSDLGGQHSPAVASSDEATEAEAETRSASSASADADADDDDDDDDYSGYDENGRPKTKYRLIGLVDDVTGDDVIVATLYGNLRGKTRLGDPSAGKSTSARTT